MLTIIVEDTNKFDATTEEFITIPGKTIQLEHSLISVSKWESIWKKPFMTTELKGEEFISYIKCMTLTQNVDDSVYLCFTQKNYEDVINYVKDPMTATWFSDHEKQKSKQKSNKRIVTSELIYYWMITLQIPKEMEKWHFNRLLTLIEVCNLENEPPKKMSQKEQLRSQAALNAARRAKHNSKG